MTSSKESFLDLVDPSERVEHHIRQAITDVDNGARLPSVRQLMHRCNASKSAVERALSRLQGEGLLESRARSGLYRTEGASMKDSVIEYLFFGPPGALEENHFHSDLFSCLSSTLAKRSKFLRLNVMKQEKDSSAVINRILRAEGGPVVMCAASINDMLLISRLSEAGIPILHLLPNFNEQIEESLVLDNEAIARLQVQHLKELQIHKVAYLHASKEDAYVYSINARRDAFLRLSIDYALQIRPGWVLYSGWEPDRIAEAVRTLLNSSDRPEALVINDGMVFGTYTGIRACGLTPGKDIAVIGCDDIPWATHVDPPLTTVRVSRSSIANMVSELMTKLVSGQKVGRNYVPVELLIRASTTSRNEPRPSTMDQLTNLRP